ncbi:pyrimidine-nucleoside phosphorylase [Hypnocyclicus thermotrophus]|uniref:Pyrimidine-nucleoside phosphorylase n=1 Tax=Hypnocyclicus thermotrophus TaxID=1627895 RepID=A0AA46E0M6_9FUSO|nr:thymidine phosphorylase [Hypnocyclicus thermotrophus]TDT72465.1 pyrimidine-nucleoside phosphorylase [Hypnocyclicus thermotrophus]
MRAVDIIQKKRDNFELTSEEISFLLDEYLEGNVPDYQMSSFLMAVYFNGMKKKELKTFTEKMMHSGDLIKFEGVNKFLIDKHSTGGVGDKTTIALAPIFASFDIGTAKLSGRGLGHTGGTIDKFESIKGFTFPETRDELVNMVNKTGIGLMGYSDKIVPLDKKLYSLRDVTATVPSIPLIASSIMSKKLAVYADGIILDVKVGSGAFMKTLKDATDLANTMLDIGDSFDRKVVAVLTDMDQPLGRAVGNTLEVIEAIETLKGNGPEEFTYLVETLAAVGLQVKGDVKTLEEGREKVWDMIKSGKPLEMLKGFIKEAGGNPGIVNDYSLLPTAKNKLEVKSDKTGHVSKIEAEMIGKSAMVLGAGRATKEDIIDHAVGLVLNKKIGDEIKEGELLATIYYNDDKNLNSSIKLLKEAYEISEKEIEKKDVILDIKSVNI